jgi:Ca2+-binding RTX toxin-like protein
LSGGDGKDVLRGAGAINGEAGDDTLFGGAAIETLNGGADNDTVSYIGSAAGVAVNLALLLPQISVGDASGDLLLGVENLIGSAHADSLTGDFNANILNGQGNADTMAGGAGNDLFYVNNGLDAVVEAVGEGYDTVAVNVSYVLAAGAEIEDLRTTNSTGTRAIDLTGNTFANILIGNAGDNDLAGGAGNDTLKGGSGNDTLRGGADNDTYFVDDTGDVVIELHGEGRDMIFVRASHVLAAGSEVEEMRTTKLAGLAAIDLTGNELNNRLLANAGINALDGGGGADRLNGSAGNDVLTGGTGKDVFTFSAALDAANNVDTITDFSSVADSIWLEGAVFSTLAAGALAVAAFAANASGLAADADDRIVYDTDSGALFYDADGVGGIDAVQFAVLTGVPTITAADFEVI